MGSCLQGNYSDFGEYSQSAGVEHCWQKKKTSLEVERGKGEYSSFLALADCTGGLPREDRTRCGLSRP
jgi:hypothetical protein